MQLASDSLHRINTYNYQQIDYLFVCISNAISRSHRLRWPVDRVCVCAVRTSTIGRVLSCVFQASTINTSTRGPFELINLLHFKWVKCDNRRLFFISQQPTEMDAKHNFVYKTINVWWKRKALTRWYVRTRALWLKFNDVASDNASYRCVRCGFWRLSRLAYTGIAPANVPGQCIHMDSGLADRLIESASGYTPDEPEWARERERDKEREWERQTCFRTPVRPAKS